MPVVFRRLYNSTSANTSSRDVEIHANHNQNSRGGCGSKTSAAAEGCASLNAVSRTRPDKDEQLLIQTKIRLSKAQAEYSKVAERLRILDALDTELTLLETRRHVIGERVFASRVHGILAAMPLFTKTRNDNVDVIDLVDDDSDCGEPIISKAASNKQCPSEA